MFDFHKTVFIHAILHNKMPKCKKITRIHKKTPQKRCFNSTIKILDFDYINLFGSSIARRAPHRNFLMRFGTRTPRVVAQTANLFATSTVRTPQKQFFCGDPEKKCRGTKCRRTIVRQGYKSPNRHKKKNVFISIWLL